MVRKKYGDKNIGNIKAVRGNEYGKIMWNVDAAFGIQEDFKSHTGAVMMLLKGSIQSISTKQKGNSRSSTEAELISIINVPSKIQWTTFFMKEKGCKINHQR